ncbi:MAG TPA: ABC transporter permease [Gemmatimonadaceae bacterium]|nr:ABC transporter permease [Gemmatimonadaceae bacterium]
MLPLLLALVLQQPQRAGEPPASGGAPATRAERTIAIDERLAADARLGVGDRVVVAGAPDAPGDTVRIAAIVRRRADPAEVARDEYTVRLHLDHLQALSGYGDRVDYFAVATVGAAATGFVVDRINDAAFGFRAHRSADIAVETSRTFAVVSRFHRAIGVITIVASATFLLCILLLKVDERRRDIAALRLVGISRRAVVRAVVIEAALIAALGSLLGIGIGWAASAIVNWHYGAVYRTPLAFALVTPEIVAFAVALSVVLGVLAGWLAAQRLVRRPPLALLGR